MANRRSLYSLRSGLHRAPEPRHTEHVGPSGPASLPGPEPGLVAGQPSGRSSIYDKQVIHRRRMVGPSMGLHGGLTAPIDLNGLGSCAVAV